MGEMYINDIVGYYLPGHLARSMNTAEMKTGRTNYEIMVEALEKHFRELGIGDPTGGADLNRIYDTSFRSREKDGFKYLYQKVRLQSQA